VCVTADRVIEASEANLTRRLRLDFRRVDCLCSQFIGRLLQVVQPPRQREGQPEICGLSPQLREVLAIAGLDRALCCWAE